MPIADDGDIVRALGFVTLYAAYVEEAVDDCVSVLITTDRDVDERLFRQPISEKIRYCQRRLRALAPLTAELQYLPDALDYTRRLLEERHDVVHGRLYAGVDGQDIRRSGRQGVPDRQVTSGELYDLANALFDARNPLLHASQFQLQRLLNRRPSDAAA
jgi:hypothetical protein